MADQLHSILSARETTHGGFGDVSRMFAHLCAAAELDAARMPAPVFTSVSMILMKLARIRCGDPGFADHWDDIAGYAALAAQSPKQEEAA